MTPVLGVRASLGNPACTSASRWDLIKALTPSSLPGAIKQSVGPWGSPTQPIVHRPGSAAIRRHDAQREIASVQFLQGGAGLKFVVLVEVPQRFCDLLQRSLVQDVAQVHRDAG